MVYKKYIKRGGKLFGPYYYRSVKKDGKVITQYVKKPEDFPQKRFSPNVKKNFNKFLIFPIIFLILIAGFFLIKPVFTGKATFSVENSYVSGEILFGNLNLNLEPNEFIPASTNLLINSNEQEYKFVLSELINEAPKQGEFFISGKDISGFGEGYGKEDLEVLFSMKIFSEPKEEKEKEKSDEIIEEQKIENISEEQNETETENIDINETEIEQTEEESPRDDSPRDDTAVPSGELSVSEIIEIEQTQTEAPVENEIIEIQETTETEITGSIIKRFFSAFYLAITGKTSLENVEKIQGKVSKDKPFIYSLEEGQTAEIIESYSEGHKNKKVNLEIINNSVVVTTDYSGDGTEYLINLSELNIPVKDKNLEIKLVYNETELYSINKNLNIENLNETIQNIQEINLTTDNSTIQYGAVLGEPVKWKKKITASEQDTIVELPAQAENISIYSLNSANKIETPNVVEPIQENLSSLTTGNLILEYKSDRKGFFSKIAKFITGRVIEVTEKEEKIEVNISENGVEYEIEYITPAPVSFEKNTSLGKEVVISSEVHYENILVYTNLLKKTNLEEIKLYQITNDLKVPVDFIAYNEKNEIVEKQNDLDDDVLAEIEKIVNKKEDETTENILKGINKSLIYGEESEDKLDYSVKKIRANAQEDLISRIEWIVPSLSNQTYELILITKAQHLDSSKNFISDIYDDVKALDNNWSEQINDSEYVRITFEKNLTNENDITIYAKSGCKESILINGIEVPCEIYEKKMRIDAIRRMMG